jgi:hypothetical protein
MVTKSLTRQITEILFESNAETARIWGTNAMGKPCGLLVKCGDDGSPSARIRSEDEEAMMMPARSEDVDTVTVPDPERFVLLPDRVGNEEPEPLGVMMCDVYEFTNGALVPKRSGKTFRDPSDLERGVTGPGIEFFYGESLEDGEPTQWNLSLPRFRDCFTPTISAGTVRALFRYGQTDDRFENPQNVPTGEESELPRLRSAV